MVAKDEALKELIGDTTEFADDSPMMRATKALMFTSASVGLWREAFEALKKEHEDTALNGRTLLWHDAEQALAALDKLADAEKGGEGR